MTELKKVLADPGALALTLVSGLAGSVLTLVLTSWRSWREKRQRQRDISCALRTALEQNLQILDRLEHRVSEPGVVLPQSGDLAALEATAREKYGLLDTATCSAIDEARGRLEAVQKAMDHYAQTWAMTTQSLNDAAGDQPLYEHRREANARLLEPCKKSVKETLAPEAREACLTALAQLERYR